MGSARRSGPRERSTREAISEDRGVTDAPVFERTKLSRVGSTAVLALASDKVNALDLEVLRRTRLASSSSANRIEGSIALVVTGEGSVFSAGLNVSEVLANDSGRTPRRCWTPCTRRYVRIFACPVPTVAAINGPAIAGGCLLACAFDKRLIAEEARIGVTELKVGVSFPTAAVELLRHVCGPHAERLMLDAGLLPAEEACRVGLAHECLPSVRAPGVGHHRRREVGVTRCHGLCPGQEPRSRRAALSAMDEESAGHSTGRFAGTGRTIGPGPAWSDSSSRRADHGAVILTAPPPTSAEGMDELSGPVATNHEDRRSSGRRWTILRPPIRPRGRPWWGRGGRAAP